MLDRPTINTPRLALRPPVPADAATIAEIVTDWEVARNLARVPHPYSVSDAEFFMEEVVPHEWVWAITLRGAHELVGVVGLTPDGTAAAELGYWLSRTQWGRGFMTEAADAVVRYAFDTIGLSLITSAYFNDNLASGRILWKLGFQETGRTTRPSLALATDMPSVEVSLHKPDRRTG